MEKKSDWPLHLAAGLFVTVLVVIVFWQPMSRGLCPTAEFLESTASQNCVDFLLNRYQTLLTGIFTLLAAALAWFAVDRQLHQAEKHATREGEKSAEALARTFLKYAEWLSQTPGDLAFQAKLIATQVSTNITLTNGRLFSEDLIGISSLLAVCQFAIEKIDDAVKNTDREKANKDIETLRVLLADKLREKSTEITDRQRSRNTRAK